MERLGCFNTPMWIDWEAEYPTIYSQMARAGSVEWSVRVFSCRFFHVRGRSEEACFSLVLYSIVLAESIIVRVSQSPS